MHRRFWLLILFLTGGLAGCGDTAQSQIPAAGGGTQVAVAEGAKSAPESPAVVSSEDPRDKEVSKRKGYRVLRTNDTQQWPWYGMPLEIEMKMPAVPEKIVKPSAPIEEASGKK
jgi:hypothetical protein